MEVQVEAGAPKGTQELLEEPRRVKRSSSSRKESRVRRTSLSIRRKQQQMEEQPPTDTLSLLELYVKLVEL